MLTYIFTRIFVELFRFIPFWLVYLISDFLSFILFSLLGYRKKVIFTNLRIAFPNKSEKEIKDIAKGFYQNFSDIPLFLSRPVGRLSGRYGC